MQKTITHIKGFKVRVTFGKEVKLCIYITFCGLTFKCAIIFKCCFSLQAGTTGSVCGEVYLD